VLLNKPPDIVAAMAGLRTENPEELFAGISERVYQ
jgi:hypothetical protein